MKLPDLRSKPFFFAFALFTLLLLLVKLKTFFNFYDEGFALVDATRALQGQVPYKDFWALYPPGQFYLIALAMKIFGSNLIVPRLYDTLVRFFLVMGAFQVARRVTSLRLAYLASFLVTLILASVGFYAYAVFPALAFGLWSLACWLIYLDKQGAPPAPRRGWLVASGLFLGLCVFFRLDIGAYAAAGLFVGGYASLALPAILPEGRGLHPEGVSQPASSSRPASLASALVIAPLAVLGWIIVPMLAVVLLGYGWVGLRAGFGNMVDQLITFPATIFHSVRWLPYPSLLPPDLIQFFAIDNINIPYLNPPSEDWLRFYLPLLTFAAALSALVVAAVRARLRLSRGFYTLLTLLIFGALCFNQALSRYDQIHVTPASILTLLLAVALLHLLTLPGRSGALKVGLSGLLIVLTMLYFIPALRELLVTLDNAAPWGCYSQLPRASCAQLSSDEEQAVELLAQLTRPGDAIYVGNQKHDRIFVSDVGFYYLVGRPAGTRYHELHPGVATTLPVQTEIARELEANHVDWAVLVKIWDSNEPNGSALSSGVTYLDDYLRANFSYQTEIGNYQIWKRIPK